MYRWICGAIIVALSVASASAADVIIAVHGTISKIDSDANTMVVKAINGTEHTMRFTEQTLVHGTEVAVRGADGVAKDSWRGLQVGSEVVAHYATRGADKTAQEIDRVGKDGLKAVEGTVTDLDRGGKKLVIKAVDGTEHAFTLTDNAAMAAGKDVDKDGAKSAKVTVYYAESGGKHIAHFFEKI